MKEQERAKPTAVRAVWATSAVRVCHQSGTFLVSEMRNSRWEWSKGASLPPSLPFIQGGLPH